MPSKARAFFGFLFVPGDDRKRSFETQCVTKHAASKRNV